MGYHEGIPRIWAGTIPSLMLVSQPTIKFTVYEFLKRHYLELYGNIYFVFNDICRCFYHDDELFPMKPNLYNLANKLALMELETALSPQKTFLIGAFANAIATLITYPVQVVQAKMRVSTYFDTYKYFFQIACMKYIFAHFLFFLVAWR